MQDYVESIHSWKRSIMKKTLLVAVMSAVVLSASPVFAEPAPADKGVQAKPSAPNVPGTDIPLTR